MRGVHVGYVKKKAFTFPFFAGGLNVAKKKERTNSLPSLPNGIVSQLIFLLF